VKLKYEEYKGLFLAIQIIRRGPEIATKVSSDIFGTIIHTPFGAVCSLEKACNLENEKCHVTRRSKIGQK
jgi:hypothetical protein